MTKEMPTGQEKTVNITVDKKSAIPYYHQVKEAVRALIAKGNLKPGDMLPSEFCLSDQLGISRLVIHRAYRELTNDGLLIRQRSKGTFVLPTSNRTHTIDGPLFSLTESMTQEGLEPSNKILIQEIITSNEEVRKELRLPPGGKVVHVRSLRFVRDLPLAIEDLFFPYDRFPKMATEDLNNSSTYKTLDRLYDAHPHDALDLISAAAASAEEAELLGLQKGAPIMCVHRVATDRKSLPVEYTIVLFHSEHYHLAVHVHRTE